MSSHVLLKAAFLKQQVLYRNLHRTDYHGLIYCLKSSHEKVLLGNKTTVKKTGSSIHDLLLIES